MLKKRMLPTFITLLVVTISSHFAAAKKIYTVGISDGFPPYQFKNNEKEATGFDADVLRLLFKNAGEKMRFQQMHWDDIVGNLRFTNKLDCIAGMEINAIRKKYFAFTSAYYSRKTALVILSDNTRIQQIEDLIGKTITGDRHSSIEELLSQKGIRKKIRIKQSKNKEESMRLLKAGKVVAMIAPKGVALHLAKKLNVKIKILIESESGSPVGIAVKKGNLALLELLESNLQTLIKTGEIARLQRLWFQ